MQKKQSKKSYEYNTKMTKESVHKDTRTNNIQTRYISTFYFIDLLILCLDLWTLYLLHRLIKSVLRGITYVLNSQTY